MMLGKVGFSVLFAVIAALLVVAVGVVAIYPNPPDTVTVGGSGRHNETVNGALSKAQAGNVTQLVLNDVQVSQFWQGYVGNVTGTIKLDDAANNTLFSWELTNPSGLVLAVNTSNAVLWNNISCVNFSTALINSSTNVAPTNNASAKINLTTLARQYNMNTTLADLQNMSKEGFNYTFNSTFSGSFNVGQTTIGVGSAAYQTNCPQANPFVDSAYQANTFKEVLLFDNNSALVFASILQDSVNGFQSGANDLTDFEMLVAEDGTPGQENTLTSYYFYVQLE